MGGEEKAGTDNEARIGGNKVRGFVTAQQEVVIIRQRRVTSAEWTTTMDRRGVCYFKDYRRGEGGQSGREWTLPGL